MRKVFKQRRGQGALEYLLLIGGAVIVAAVVLTLVTGLTATGQQAAQSRATDALCAPFAKQDCSLKDPDGTGSLNPLDCIWSSARNACSPSTLSSGNVLFMNFDAQSSDGTKFSDVSGNTNHGTMTNGAAGVLDTQRQTIVGVFDGKDDFVNVADSPSIQFSNNSFTISAWVYYSSNDDRAIMAKGDRGGNSENTFILGASNSPAGVLYVSVGKIGGTTDGVAGTVAITQNQWNHVAATYDTTKTTGGITIYLNGTVYATGNRTATALNPSTGNPLVIGRHAESNCVAPVFSCWLGRIDEVGVWNRVLSPAEILRLYNSR